MAGSMKTKEWVRNDVMVNVLYDWTSILQTWTLSFMMTFCMRTRTLLLDEILTFYILHGHFCLCLRSLNYSPSRTDHEPRRNLRSDVIALRIRC